MAKKKAAAAAGAVAAAKDNPYVQRIVSDDDLRDNVRVAFDAAKSAYERLSNGKAPSKALMDDKKLHKDLKEAAEALRDAGAALRQAPKKQRKQRRGGFGRKLEFHFVDRVDQVLELALEPQRSRVPGTARV